MNRNPNQAAAPLRSLSPAHHHDQLWDQLHSPAAVLLHHTRGSCYLPPSLQAAMELELCRTRLLSSSCRCHALPLSSCRALAPSRRCRSSSSSLPLVAPMSMRTTPLSISPPVAAGAAPAPVLGVTPWLPLLSPWLALLGAGVLPALPLPPAPAITPSCFSLSRRLHMMMTRGVVSRDSAVMPSSSWYICAGKILRWVDMLSSTKPNSPTCAIVTPTARDTLQV
mmetsp:Transcript_16165/g.35014  ORF Transcript_16165/g.35014 Transcript_16165/m.35014 type:complete len:224 (-) Transcript_16165:1747-2418(-)